MVLMDFFPGFPVPVTLVFDSAQQSRDPDASGSFPVSPEGRRRMACWNLSIQNVPLCILLRHPPPPSIS